MLGALPCGHCAVPAAPSARGSVPAAPCARHYYRVQGDDLLIEYDTTDDGNHTHTVLRRPRSDFGDDVLAEHYRRERGQEGTDPRANRPSGTAQ